MPALRLAVISRVMLLGLLGEFSLVPLVVGDAGAEAVAQVLELLWGGDETLIVISSDLSHYLPYAAPLSTACSIPPRAMRCVRRSRATWPASGPTTRPRERRRSC